MIKAAVVDIGINLKPLSDLLWQQGLRHRISEESGMQVIWVVNDQQAELVRQLVDNWDKVGADMALHAASSNIATDHNKVGIRGILQSLLKFIYLFRLAPVTLFLIVICLIVALITELGSEPYRLDMLFFPALPLGGLAAMLSGINGPIVFLQTLTPMFIHFGELHMIFNLVWLWYFGRQLETVHSSKLFLLIVIITSFMGNTAQYWYSESSNFGGMSGVVYGLVAYAWILNNFVPGIQLMINNSMFLVFIAALVITGFVAPAQIATAAHIGGFVAGLAAGLVLLVANKLGQNEAKQR